MSTTQATPATEASRTVPADRHWRHRAPSGLSRWQRVSLWVSAALTVIGVAGGVFSYATWTSDTPAVSVFSPGDVNLDPQKNSDGLVDFGRGENVYPGWSTATDMNARNKGSLPGDLMVVGLTTPTCTNAPATLTPAEIKNRFMVGLPVGSGGAEVYQSLTAWEADSVHVVNGSTMLGHLGASSSLTTFPVKIGLDTSAGNDWMSTDHTNPISCSLPGLKLSLVLSTQ